MLIVKICTKFVEYLSFSYKYCELFFVQKYLPEKYENSLKPLP